MHSVVRGMLLGAPQSVVRAGKGHLRVDESLLQLATVRASFTPFRTDAAAASVTVARESFGAQAGLPLQGLERTYGVFRVNGELLSVDVAEDGYAAIAAVRLGYHLVVARGGGVLLHAAAVTFGDRAVMAFGQSGAGKSTLARLLVDAGGTLLSDEIVALYPDGTLVGTPFRSDFDAPGDATPVTLALAVTLQHGGGEWLRPLGPAELMRALAAQLYRPEGGELSSQQALSRAGEALGRARLAELTFRRDPEAGHFVRRQIDAAAAT